ncbi:HD domain-containing protein [Verrucomicrobiaceae bacterium 5K15]|uniref:HD domain-containing protein n=1 Tax=Oceaniferula flava TaxID=2800421 RepID=A0AAE2SAY3_9BACT|nr:HD domain-containing protein [Oceaniferula flavus]MBK1854776.1 HD domain-containing protein [Oceaniferula flavus]MBM1136082.1 HD domain-containing protein [Oceaniferula flavus]
MQHLSISSLRKSTADSPLSASFDAQLERKAERETKTGKPFYEITLVDGTGDMKLKVWENRPQFRALDDLPEGSLLRVSGEWTQNQYGMDSAKWDMRLLNESEGRDFLAGDPETRQKQDADWADILQMTGDIADPRLHALCAEFILHYGDRFRRSAAARKNHHARRGGLVEHVAQMMRSAWAICGVYPKLNRDLLTAGVLFHDCGKMWENNYPEAGFTQPHNIHGEMLGHIPLGIETANKIWRDLKDQPQSKAWQELTPESEDVQLHLLHLIASHHGTHEWGSPTLPRTPEAMALHYIDNLDAKYEMMSEGYESSPELAPGIQERKFPLPASLVTPLTHFSASPGVAPSAPKQESIELPLDELF